VSLPHAQQVKAKMKMEIVRNAQMVKDLIRNSNVNLASSKTVNIADINMTYVIQLKLLEE